MRYFLQFELKIMNILAKDSHKILALELMQCFIH